MNLVTCNTGQYSNTDMCSLWWLIPIISVFGKLKQENYGGFRTSLDCRVIPCPKEKENFLITSRKETV